MKITFDLRELLRVLAEKSDLTEDEILKELGKEMLSTKISEIKDVVDGLVDEINELKEKVDE